ncbi:hypothetical protein Desaci_1623 [Desulfosporosinus acidiphilus SJ4]|uniref:Uncharacterized protein n=1 Tax=Desulfosporosinus acidiphilus (strain DSM 22704 / JCM 16185 / SJ4) TaxID=646529 RepID=I4D4A1_DESAJ|nr:hypothetical protein Desaci_1623 [Desulfosporosinus acidiphilus SJ4]
MRGYSKTGRSTSTGTLFAGNCSAKTAVLSLEGRPGEQRIKSMCRFASTNRMVMLHVRKNEKDLEKAF